MALELVDGSLDGYRVALAAGERGPGAVNWPIPFDLC